MRFTWSIYRLSDGVFDRTFTGSENSIEGAVPPGCGFLLGVYDHKTQRVDTDTGEVVPRQPPIDMRRGELMRMMQGEIEAQERSQARPLRELVEAQLAGERPAAETLERWAAIKASIAQLQSTRRALAAARDDAELDAALAAAYPPGA